MRIDLIAPEKEGDVYLNRVIFAPLGLVSIAAYTPEGVDVRIIDENLETINFDDRPDLVGITVMTSTARRAYEIADRYRQSGVKVVLGGIHPSFEPDEALRHADSIVMGEAEDLWPGVVEDAMEGKLQPVYKADGFCDFSRPELPRRDLLKKKGYWSVNNMQTSRGCPHSCSYCSVTAFNGGRVRHRDIDNVLAEVESLPVNRIARKRMAAFIDDNIAASPARAKKLFNALKPLNIVWGSQACINIADDEEVVALASESGCRFLFIGLETVSKSALAEVGKHQNKVEKYEESLRILRKHKIQVMGAFMFGFDSDDYSVFNDTLRFAINNKIQVAQFSNLHPLPGTRIYDQFVNEGRAEHGFWLDSSLRERAVFNPKKLSPYELVRRTHEVSKKFYSYRSITKRLVPNPHWIYYFMGNMLYHYSSVERSRVFQVPSTVPGAALAGQ